MTDNEELATLQWLHAEAVWRLEVERDRHVETIAERDRLRADAESLLDIAKKLHGRKVALEVEVSRVRREVEFEANGERWGNAIVGRDGHEYVHGAAVCSCGASCPRLRDWSDHLLASRVAEGKPLCACISENQAAHLGAGFSPPACAVHPDEALLAVARAREAADTGVRIPLESAAAEFGVDLAGSDDFPIGGVR